MVTSPVTIDVSKFVVNHLLRHLASLKIKNLAYLIKQVSI